MLKIHENQPSNYFLLAKQYLLYKSSSKFDPSTAGNTYTYIENSSWRYCSKIVLTTVVTEAQG